MFTVLLVLAFSALTIEIIANRDIEGGSLILDYPLDIMDEYSAKAKRDECSECLKLDEPIKRTGQLLTKNALQNWMNKLCPETCYPDKPKKESDESNYQYTKRNNRNNLRTRISIAAKMPVACMRLFHMDAKECQGTEDIFHYFKFSDNKFR